MLVRFGKLVLLAALLSGCRGPRNVCEAQTPIEIRFEDGTDNEYMPGVTPIVAAPSNSSAAVEVPWPLFRETLKEETRIEMLRRLRNLGEPPLTRVAGQGDAMRCLAVISLYRMEFVGRLVHAPGVTRQHAQEVHRCPGRPHPIVGSRHDEVVSEGAWTHVAECLRASHFDSTPLINEFSYVEGTDGTDWFLETVHAGRYHAALMHLPSHRNADGSPTPVLCCAALLGPRSVIQSFERWPESERNGAW